MRRTKIIATVGPASSGDEMLRRLLAAGVDVFRLNYSHGDHATHAAAAARIRKVAAAAGREVALLQDLAGPKIRTGDIEGGGEILLGEGEEILLVREPGPVRPGRLTTSRPALVDELEAGHRLLLRDGRLRLRARSRDAEGVRLLVERGGPLAGRGGINLPDTALSVPALTDKDVVDLAHGREVGVDLVALSFVRRPGDLERAREAAGGHELFLVAKIERPEAVEHLDAILDRADAVMIARGDLGVEIPAEDVPLVQKRIIRAANARHIPVITATQMLESMVDSPVPTRAEASDVANAILDGTDAVMLSAETATGNYPEEAVRIMGRIAERTEVADVGTAPAAHAGDRGPTPPGAIAQAASRVAEDVRAKAIVVYTESGATARLLSAQRPRVPVFALSPELATVRRLLPCRGVAPSLMPRVEAITEMLRSGEQRLVEAGQVRVGDRVVVVSGSRSAHRGGTNTLKVLTIGELD